MSRANTDADFWARVTPTGFCWEFNGSLTHEGYGHFYMKSASSVLVHRIAYELLVGEIPAGMQLDHLCRTRNCVNPDHLEPLAPGEHSLRSARWRMIRETCVNGHPRTEDNLLSLSGEYYRCRQCVLVRTHAKRGKACSYDEFCGARSHSEVTRRVVPVKRKVPVI